MRTKNETRLDKVLASLGGPSVRGKPRRVIFRAPPTEQEMQAWGHPPPWPTGASGEVPALPSGLLEQLSDAVPCPLEQLLPWADVLAAIMRGVRGKFCGVPIHDLRAVAKVMRKARNVVEAAMEGQAAFFFQVALRATYEGKEASAAPAQDALQEAFCAFFTLELAACLAIGTLEEGTPRVSASRPPGARRDATVFQLACVYVLATNGRLPRHKPNTTRERSTDLVDRPGPFLRLAEAFLRAAYKEKSPSHGEVVESLRRLGNVSGWVHRRYPLSPRAELPHDKV